MENAYFFVFGPLYDFVFFLKIKKGYGNSYEIHMKKVSSNMKKVSKRYQKHINIIYEKGIKNISIHMKKVWEFISYQKTYEMYQLV